MPFITINLGSTDLHPRCEANIAADITASISITLHKPPTEIAVLVTQHGHSLFFGQEAEPCAVVEMRSIGYGDKNSGEDSKNKSKLIADITQVLAARVPGLSPLGERVMICFRDAPACDFGINGHLLG